MRFEGNRKSTNVEDRGGSRGTGGRLPGGILSGGIGGIITLVLIFFLSGGNILPVINNLDILTSNTGVSTSAIDTSDYEHRKEFVSVVFAHLEDYWTSEFREYNRSYTNPKMVLYSGKTNTACGTGLSQMGPFYCPGDQKVYIDLAFMDELKHTYGVDGDFAMAYVIAHEVGHHVQYELGISDKINILRQRLPEKQYNKYSVQLELQADYFAGMWTKYLEGERYNGLPILEVGDIDEALNAAFAVGDDTLQAKYQGFVVEESFTHGSSKQRKDWFYRGYKYGDFEHADTFKEAGLTL